MHLLSLAAAYAISAHNGHLRKVLGTPYIGHPLAVAGSLLSYGGSIEAAAAALLHDTVEDRSCDLNEITRLFGARVGFLVSAVTEPSHQAEWPFRKRTYLKQIEGSEDDEVPLLSGCDKLDNIRSMATELAVANARREPDAKFGFYAAVLAVVRARAARGGCAFRPGLLAMVNHYDAAYCNLAASLDIGIAQAAGSFLRETEAARCL